jgi:EmrB/QacA subfamily drug resistance transporter
MEKLRGNRWLSLTILLIGFLMILIDTTIVNVSIPTLIKDIGASLTQIEWIISGYSLSFAALLITFGRLGDMYGRRNFFLAGLFVFALSSFFAGHATSPDTLITARILQGIGAAMISPSSLSIISATFKGRERATAFALFGSTAGIAAALGPVLGGYFTTYHSWRDIFYVNIPVGIVGIILGLLLIPESKIEGKERIDFAGMLTSAIGFFFLVFALIEGQNYGWLKPNNQFKLGSLTWTQTHFSVIPVAIILGLLFLLAFTLIEASLSRRDLEPAVDTRLFHSRAFSIGLITIAVVALGEFSSLFTLPIFLQSVKGFTPLHSGYASLPIALGSFVTAPISAKLVGRFGTKRVITAGISLETLGLFLFSLIKVGTPYSHLWPALLCLGVGLGLAIAQNTQATLSEIPPRQAGSASGVLNTVRQVGTALGIAIVGAVLAHQTTINIKSPIDAIAGLPASAKAQVISQAGDQSVSYSGAAQAKPAQLPPAPLALQGVPGAIQRYDAALATTEARIGTEIKSAVDTALVKSIGQAVRVGVIFMLLGAVISLWLPNIKHDEDEAAPAAH